MCGIIGYTGNKKINDVLINGLKKLEYRGYDSAGIAAWSHQGQIEIIKSIGKISNLVEKVKSNNTSFVNCGIGHTRWATHGVPSEINAHPHQSNQLVLVHNGIIENYMELKQELLIAGYEFYSQTDTEVACKYIDYIYKTEKDKLKCIKMACDKFRGSYAFAILFFDEKDTIYATRRNSPLVIGVSDQGNFISSDVSAFLDSTGQYILLQHDEFARITSTQVEIFDFKFDKVVNKIEIADWEAASYEKAGYEHFMLKEIYEQPSVVKNVFHRFLENSTDICSMDMNRFNSIHIVACGSAMHAGLVGKYLFETYANIPVTVEVASEYRYKNQLLSDKTLVIIVSQSGETADTLAALRIAKEHGAYTLAIVNVVGSTIAREADSTIYTYAGPEIAVATTKGYSSQVAVLSVIALNMAQSKISEQQYSSILNELSNIEELINQVIIPDQIERYKDIASVICMHNDLFFIGRGIDSGLCMEGSLKLKEISYMHSEAYAAGELKHGTISLIEDGTPVIAIATNERLYEKTVSNIKETKARGAYTILVTTTKLDEFSEEFDKKVVLPSVSEFSMAILVSISLQLIAYFTAKNRGCDIDKPKNLAKSVTVE